MRCDSIKKGLNIICSYSIIDMNGHTHKYIHIYIYIYVYTSSKIVLLTAIIVVKNEKST